MKLHLPKMLLAAVVAVLGVQYAGAAVTTEVKTGEDAIVIGTGEDAKTYNVTLVTGNSNTGIKISGDGMTDPTVTPADGTIVGFAMTSSTTGTDSPGRGAGNYFSGNSVYAGDILVYDDDTSDATDKGLIINNGNGSQVITFGGAVSGNGTISIMSSAPSGGITLKFTGDMSGYTGTMKGGSENKYEFNGATSGTGILTSTSLVKVIGSTMKNSTITAGTLEVSGTSSFAGDVTATTLTIAANTNLTFAADTVVTLDSISGTSGTINFGEGAKLVYNGPVGSSGSALEHTTYGYKVDKTVDLLGGTLAANRDDITVVVNGTTATMTKDGYVAALSDYQYYIDGEVNASTVNASGDDLSQTTGYMLSSGKLILDEDFTITGASTILDTQITRANDATTKLIIASGSVTSVNSNDKRNFKTDVQVDSGATLQFTGGYDAFDYDKTRTITVEGTVDMGTTRQTVGNWTFDLKGGTISGEGTLHNNNMVALDFHAVGKINAKALEGATAEAPTVSTVSANIRMNKAVSYDVEANARLDVTGAIVGNEKLTKTGSGTLRLANNANTYNAVEVNGGLLEVRDDAVTMNQAVTVNNGAEMRLQRNSGSATLANVTLNGGKLLSQGKSNGSADMTVTNLTVGENGGTIGTMHDDVYGHSYNGTVSIGSLSADSETARTLKLVAAHNLNATTTISLNGGAVEGKNAFTGTVNVGVDSSSATRTLDLKIADASVLEKAVVEVGLEGEDDDKYHINMKLAADTVKLAGIKDIAGRLSHGDVAKDSGYEGTSTLSINTGAESYATKYRVTGGINIVKDGTGTQSFGGNMSEFGSAEGIDDGHVEVKGGVLQFSNASGTMTAESLTLSGGTLDVAGSLTLNALTLDLSKYATTQLEHELVSAGTSLSLGEKVNLAALGGTVGEYTATVSLRNNSLWLTYATPPEELGTLEVSSAVLTGNVLTLNIDANLTDVSSVDLMLSAQALADIKGLTGPVSLALDANDGLFTTVVTDGATLISNVSFYNGAYTGEGAGMYKVEYIPEPTTATLSLLALAGLAARRRRK